MFANIFFILSATLAVGGACLCATSKNLMHACIFLLGSLFGVAGLYATLGADFLAATQMVVYAGGVVILMIFAVMLTGGHEDKVNRLGLSKIAAMGSTKTYIIAGLTSLVIAMVILKIIASSVKGFTQGVVPAMSATVKKIGTLLATDHILAFEISSVLLLGALIGAAVIARPRENS